MSIPQIKIAGNSVGRMGYGLMQLTWNPQPPPEEESFAAMKAAADAGATAWSTATFYGPPDNGMANLKLIRSFFDKYPDYASKITIVMKGGMEFSAKGPRVFDQAGLQKDCRAELKKAQEILGDKKIDAYSLARFGPGVDPEKAAEDLKVLLDEGLFGAVALSEVKAETIEKVNKVVPVTVVEIEVSLWTYEPDTKASLAICEKLHIPVFCYSPLGRGFITRKWKTPEDIPEGSFQRTVPRFQGEAFYENLKLVDRLDEFAEKKGVTTSQLALAWVVGLNDVTVPIPGSSKPDRARQNTEAASMKLSPEESKAIDDILSKFEVKGGRYDDHNQALLMR